MRDGAFPVTTILFFVCWIAAGFVVAVIFGLIAHAGRGESK